MAQFYKIEKRGKIELAKAPNPVKVTTTNAKGQPVLTDFHIYYGWTEIDESEFDKLTIDSFLPGIKAKLQESIDNDPDSFRWNYGDIMDTLPPLVVDDKDLQEVIEKILPIEYFKPTPKKGK